MMEGAFTKGIIDIDCICKNSHILLLRSLSYCMTFRDKVSQCPVLFFCVIKVGDQTSNLSFAFW